MAALGLWDVVAPYFLLGVSPSEVQAALAAVEVDDFDSSSDELGAVIRWPRAVRGRERRVGQLCSVDRGQREHPQSGV
jgi:hypothetical protein